MHFFHREAEFDDLENIVEIYNHAVAAGDSTCDPKPISVVSRQHWFWAHARSRRPIWVAEDADAPECGAIAYLALDYFLNRRRGYDVTADLELYVHPGYRRHCLGSYLLGEAIRRAPSLRIEVLAVTVLADNTPSLRLFERHGFERWGYLPHVARLGDIAHDVHVLGLRLQ